MGGGEKDKANRMQDETYTRSQQQQDEFNTRQKQEYDTAQAHSKDLYGSLSGGYKSMASAPVGYQPSYDPLARSTAQDFAKTGGISDQQRGSINDTIGGFKDIGKTGGLSDENINRMQGGGYYDEFAKTGGVSDADKANIRARAGSPITAAYKRANDVGNQMASIQGGYGPGAQVLRDRALRGANADASNASLNAEGAIMDRVQQGRQFGVSGLSDSAIKTQGLRTGNMLSGLSGAGGLDMDLARATQQGRQYGASQLSSLDDTANMDQRYQGQLALDQQKSGLAGLTSLYGGAPGELNATANRDLSGDQSYEGQQGGIAGDKLASNKSGWENVTGAIGSIAGAAGGVLGGVQTYRPQQKPVPYA